MIGRRWRVSGNWRTWTSGSRSVDAVVAIVIAVALVLAVWRPQAFDSGRFAMPLVGVRGVAAADVVAARDAGNYRQARELLARGLGNAPADQQLLALQATFSQRVEPQLRLRYVKRSATGPTWLTASGAPELGAADEYRFILNLPCHCYAYLFLVDSIGAWTAVLPNRAVLPMENPLRAGEYWLPGQASGGLHPVAYPGAERLYAVVTAWRHRVFEDFATRLAAPQTTQARRSLSDELLTRLRHEQQSKGVMPGFAIGSLELHNGSTPASNSGER